MESAFDCDEPQITKEVDCGILQKSLAVSVKIQHAVYNYLHMCQPSKNPKNKFFQKKWHELILKKLMQEPIAQKDYCVVPLTISMLIRLLSAEKNKYTDVDSNTLQL